MNRFTLISKLCLDGCGSIAYDLYSETAFLEELDVIDYFKIWLSLLLQVYYVMKSKLSLYLGGMMDPSNNNSI